MLENEPEGGERTGANLAGETAENNTTGAAGAASGAETPRVLPAP
nr:hypothetical protein [Micromonospora tarapacensis]